MKKIILSFAVSCLLSVTATQAQFLSLFTKEQKTTTYNKENKKAERENKKEIKEIKKTSYTPTKSPHYNKKEAKEAQVSNLRQKRLKEGKTVNKDKEVKLVQKKSAKKNQKKNEIRAKKIKANKNNYGTKKSRKGFQTHKSEKYVFENDKDNSFTRTKNKGKSQDKNVK